MNKKLIPNGISLLRPLVCAPALGYCVGHGQWAFAFGILLLGHLTDFLDGLVANWLDAKSAIGKNFVDPLCDASLMGTALVALIVMNYLSVWVFVVLALVTALFYVSIGFAPRRLARFLEGVFPFYGVSLEVFLAVEYAIIAFGKTTTWYFVLLFAALSPLLIWIKRRRIREAVNYIRSR